MRACVLEPNAKIRVHTGSGCSNTLSMALPWQTCCVTILQACPPVFGKFIVYVETIATILAGFAGGDEAAEAEVLARLLQVRTPSALQLSRCKTAQLW